MAEARVAVDIGGTFTDVALDAPSGRFTAKTLTTPDAPSRGVMAGLEEAMRGAGVGPGEVAVIIHGTTLATNALIERRGAKTALLTTEGHRDSLEMAQENRFEQYDVNIDRPAPLVPRWLRLPIRERMNYRGEVLLPLDEASVRAALATLDAEGVESVAIGFLHAYANRAHEERAGEILAAERPELSVTLASEVAPEIREYERLSTAVANAYVRPLMESYLRALEGELKAAGFSCPFLLMTSGGGLAAVETAARFPIRLVESGPAGGAVLAAAIAREAGAREALSFDMGGSTAKLCLIDDFTPPTARLFEVDRSYRFKKGSGLPVRIPVIDMVEIGAGGGSIAAIDALGRVQVGPESAGSSPGPAAYGRGGARATVTDADVLTGRIDPGGFAGGAIGLDAGAARAAVEEEVARPLGLSPEAAASALGEVVDENMAAAARAHAVENGRDVSARVMIAFGGAAPLHAARLAEKLGLRTIIIPANAGVGSAVGFLLAPAAYEVVRSHPARLDALDEDAIAALFEGMRAEAGDIVGAAAPGAPVLEERRAYMRYAGQGYEIAVDLADGAGALARRLGEAFEKAYRSLYGRILPAAPIEILSWSLALSARPAARGPGSAGLRVETSPQERPGRAARRVFDTRLQAWTDYVVVARSALAPGEVLEGPALIEEAQTTTVVTPVFDAVVDARGHIILERNERAHA